MNDTLFPQVRTAVAEDAAALPDELGLVTLVESRAAVTA